MIEGIILAAGRSRRAGVFKPAHLHDGRPLLLHALDGLAAWCDRTVVVAGHRSGEVTALLADRAEVAVVTNPDPDAAMFSSIRIAAEALTPTGRGFFVLPVDCPLVSPAVYESLLEAFDDEHPVVPELDGRGGHPVLLPTSARAAILAAPDTATLRHIVADLDPVRVPVADPAVRMDLDTPADLAALEPTSGKDPA